ncbi:hypothetical protein J6Y73_01005 [bacterium]|nr:hypothetical protein [bacterium]
MNYKNDFKKLYDAFIKNAVKKSLFYSLFISFAVLFVISLTFWIVDVKEFWIAFIVFGVLEIALFFIFYHFLKPNDVKFSKELDALGLEQRVITMYEYQDDDSLMAKVQRENAVEHIRRFDVKLLKFVIPVLLLVFMISSVVLGVSASTVSVLSATGVIKSGKETISDIIPQEEVYYTISYTAKKGGIVEGELNQVIKAGEDAEAVIAVSTHGYIFVSWSDGVRDPYRKDIKVSKNLDIFASFISIDEYMEMLKNPGEPEIPEEPAQGNIPIPKDEGDGDPLLQRYDENSQIIDGETYYGESVFDGYQQDMIEMLAQDTEMSTETKKIINDYFDTIEK